jgi:ABC-type transport system involved in multi-copper enzyme maturation permease subunit
MQSLWTLATATYGDITRRPLYYILLGVFAAAIYFSKLLTLFSFYQEMQMVREMGMATITFWGFIVIAVTSGIVVTQELDDRTAVTLLSKPIRRIDFLLGKFAGLVLMLIPGMFILAGILFVTLLMMALPHLPLGDAEIARRTAEGAGPFVAAWGALWKSFVLKQGGVVLEGAFLCFLQGTILAALSVSFSAFFPQAVATAATTLIFILGNVSSYMVASVESLGAAPLSALGRAASYLLPNLGYFNLQTAFSEGKIISLGYLSSTFAYTVLYVSAVLLVSCSLFRRREIR